MFTETLKYGTQYSAIEHAEQDSYHYLQLTKKKQELVVSARKKATSFQEFLPQLKGLKHHYLLEYDRHYKGEYYLLISCKHDKFL